VADHEEGIVEEVEKSIRTILQLADSIRENPAGSWADANNIARHAANLDYLLFNRPAESHKGLLT
jgi:hypothetical protein